MASLLARFAENTFWMARYMERAENLARIIDVNETYAQDGRGVREWLPIVQLHDDAERFFAIYPNANAEPVLHFYILDRNNPTSIIAAVRLARENARSVRHLISTEAWAQLNVFHNRLMELKPADLRLSQLSRLCTSIKESCQAHAGIVDGTFYRDQNWFFYQLGRFMERADSTTRLLDISYHRLMPVPDVAATAVDASQWNALLRSVAGYQAFRRSHHRGMVPAQVASFLLFDQAFPRSFRSSVMRCNDLLGRLRALPEFANHPIQGEALSRLSVLADTQIEDILAAGLHDFLDQIQRELIRLTAEFGSTFFGHAHDAAGTSQCQTQDGLPLPPPGDVRRAPGDVPPP